MSNKLLRFAILLTALAAAPCWAGGKKGGDTRVRGYMRGGTYVAPHMRSAPDGNFSNNWSTRGNVNPYTGEPGTKTRNPNTGRSSSSGWSASTGGQIYELSEPMTLPYTEKKPAQEVAPRPPAPPVAQPPIDDHAKALLIAERGLAHYQAGRFAAAIHEYRAALELDPFNERLYYCRGVMHSRLGDYEEAIKDLNDAIRMKPQFKEAHIALAHACQKKGELLPASTAAR